MIEHHVAAEGRNESSYLSNYPYFEDVNEGVLRQLPPLHDVPAARVLDLGCGYGALGEAIRALGYEVWGVDNNPIALRKAERRLDHVIRGNISDPSSLLNSLGNTTFDYLVFSDVLEHLVDPIQTLCAYRPFLNNGGRVVVSLPNVANWHTRLGLLFGNFNYTDFGVLDRTHLHFFTAKSARRLVEDAGFSIMQADFTPLILRALAPIAKQVLSKRGDELDDPTRAIIDSTLYSWYSRAIYPVEYFLCKLVPGLLAFRIILVAH